MSICPALSFILISLHAPAVDETRDAARNLLNLAASPNVRLRGQFDSASLSIREVPGFSSIEYTFKTSLIVFSNASKRLMFLRISDETFQDLEHPLDDAGCISRVLSFCNKVGIEYDLTFRMPKVDERSGIVSVVADIGYRGASGGTLTAQVDPRSGAITNFNAGHATFAPPSDDPPEVSKFQMQESMALRLAERGYSEIELGTTNLEVGYVGPRSFELGLNNYSPSFARAVATPTSCYTMISWIRDLSDQRVVRVLQDPWSGELISVLKLRGKGPKPIVNRIPWYSITDQALLLRNGKAIEARGSSIQPTLRPDGARFDRRFVLLDGKRCRAFTYDCRLNRVRFDQGKETRYVRVTGRLKDLLASEVGVQKHVAR